MRSCGDCTKCCEGWLTGNVRGHEFYPGKPCFFLTIGVGCNDYDNRPADPCKTFSCDWLVNDLIPEEFKPNAIETIFLKTFLNGIEYLKLVPAGNDIDDSIISWAIDYAESNSINLWIDKNGNRVFGSKEFLEEFDKTGIR